MDSDTTARLSRHSLVLVAASVLAVVAVQVAVARQGSSPEATSAAAKSSKKQLWRLRHRVSSLEWQLASLPSGPVGAAAG